VPNCTLIQAPLCELTWLIDDFMEPYRVRVQTVTANGVSEWAVLRKFLPNDSKALLLVEPLSLLLMGCWAVS
jgi:hypothetical protein